ncbi:MULTISPECIES: heavy-metal-associated domain-containing protein [Brevibacterium]|uniref:Heavy metal transport/detoxification protein n=1 Tax=Brevibacterium linens TaxID=1703 RepID=A0A0B8ZXY7_BRELN|nr:MULTISPECIES: cation transporter [Brevibacterium]KHS51126.1 Heavy metal transport/detoxification protein [Brevibacterium linens]
MTTTTITVSGMTCGHCEAAVKEELGALAGVSDVAVDLNAGGDSPVTITSSNELDDAAIRAAVDEAGYEVK